MKRNIRKQFAALVILLGILLLVSGLLLVWQIFTVQKKQAHELQTEVGKRAINEFAILTHEIEDNLLSLTKLTPLLSLSPAEQENTLSKLRSHKDKRHNDILDELVLLDDQGKVLSFASRTHLSPPILKPSWRVLAGRLHGGKTYYSPVDIAENGEPFMVFAVPLVNLQTGDLQGALLAHVRMNQVWEEIVHKPVGQKGVIYITDGDGRIISHPNYGLVRQGAILEPSESKTISHWLRDDAVVRVVQDVAIGNQSFAIVVERPASEALGLTIQVVILLVIFGLFFLFIALASGFVFTRKIIRPIESLARTAQKIKDGDLSCTAEVDSNNELGLLAKSFNGMTSQLTQDIEQLKMSKGVIKEAQAGLEDEVAKRTAALQHLLECSKMLTSTRDLQRLYRQAVELGQTLFKLDFSTIILLTDDRKTLVVRDTIGFPQSSIGNASSVDGHGIASYVMKKAEPVLVEDFNTESRFKIPSIVVEKNITSAVAFPMLIGDEVLGVFIGYTQYKREFARADIELCQSFVNQVVVALDNAIHVQNLHESELKFKELFDNINDAVLVYDLQGGLLEVNQVTCERLGYSRDELLQLSSEEFVAPQFLAGVEKRIQAVTANKKDIFETAHVSKAGVEIPIELSCTLFEYEGQQAILGVARDISERKKMEEELIKNRKLESVGVLAGGIAHDFNNILAAIIGNINLATLQIDDADSPTQEFLSSAEKAAFRAKDLTKQLLTFSQGGEPVKEIASIAEVIEDSTDFILRGTHVKGVCHFADDLWPVVIDAGQISQVIQNIVLNGCDAMGGGGLLEIHCDNAEIGGSSSLPLDRGEYVRITIQDNGPGISANNLKRIFDPYFSTKEDGSGLGLAITHSIIHKHDGAIFADSPHGQGALFTIYLKAARHETIEPQPNPVVSAEKSGKGTVMVMDDDVMIRDVSKGLLTSLGYNVMVTEDGQGAIDLYQENGADNIDVIIMDLTIPGGMGGKQAVQEIHKLNPAAKVIVSSGYSNDPVMANYEEYGFCAAIDKPYQLSNLMKVLERVIA